jgi:hypothetical protein
MVRTCSRIWRRISAGRERQPRRKGEVRLRWGCEFILSCWAVEMAGLEWVWIYGNLLGDIIYIIW